MVASDASDSLPPAAPRGKPRFTFLAIGVSCLLAAAPAGFGGANTWLAPPNATTFSEKLWGAGAALTAVALLLSAGSGLALVPRVCPRRWRVAQGSLILAAAASLGTTAVGFLMVADAKHRGGDWGGLAVAVARILTMASALCALVPIVGLVGLFLARRKLNDWKPKESTYAGDETAPGDS